jgi:hypothetical protein
MFCPNCGSKIESENQKFCQNCGYNLSEVHAVSQMSDRDYKTVSHAVKVPEPTYSTPPVRQFKPKVNNIPGPYSKKALGFGIPSVIIGLVALAVGYSGYTVARTYWMYSIPDHYGLVFWPVLLVVHVIGLIFGIVSRKNSGLAANMEPLNNVANTGSTFGTIGIIINTILICVVLFVFFSVPH